MLPFSMAAVGSEGGAGIEKAEEDMDKERTSQSCLPLLMARLSDPGSAGESIAALCECVGGGEGAGLILWLSVSGKKMNESEENEENEDIINTQMGSLPTGIHQPK